MSRRGEHGKHSTMAQTGTQARAQEAVHLPGTTLEGGGQLLRLAIALSSLRNTPVRITDIRGNRSGGGGLKAQHLTSVQWLARACGARVSGAGLKSRELVFVPHASSKAAESAREGIPRKGREVREVTITQSTPGSANLVFQAVLPYLLFSSSFSSSSSSPAEVIHLRITGGTNVSNSPSADYIQQVLSPMLALIGLPHISVTIESRGWSHGGAANLGCVLYAFAPLARCPLPAFRLTHRGDVESIRATVLAPKDAAQSFADELEVLFATRGTAFFGADGDPVFDVVFEDSRHPKRFYLLLVARTASGARLGRDWLYDHAVRGSSAAIAAAMVKRVANDLAREIAHGGCVDEWFRDQVVVFQALAAGRSEVDAGKEPRRAGGGKGKAEIGGLSLHARTAMWVVNQMLGVEFDDEGACVGVGHVPGSSEAGESIEADGGEEQIGKVAGKIADLEIRDGNG